MAKAVLKKTSWITDREDAERALARLGQALDRIAAVEAAGREQIRLAQEKMEQATAGDYAIVQELEEQIETWARDNRDELFKNKKSLSLRFGEIGFRLTPWKIRFLGKAKVKTIVEKLRANKLAHLIRKTESVDKEKAVLYDNETLARVGMKKTRKDEFYYELKPEVK